MDAPKVPYIINSIAEDNTNSHEEALLRIYQRLRPGNPPALEKARTLFHEKFFDINRYRLGRVGRFRVNRKLGLEVPEDEMALRPEDLVSSIRYLIDLFDGETDARFDDIDHLALISSKNQREHLIESFRRPALFLNEAAGLKSMSPRKTRCPFVSIRAASFR